MSVDLAMNIDLEGIRIPDSKLAREIMELVRDKEDIIQAFYDGIKPLGAGKPRYPCDRKSKHSAQQRSRS